MDGDKVCFNRELLNGFGLLAEEYQNIAVKITGGAIAASNDACVAKENVDQSFVTSGLNASKFEDISEHAKNRPYYRMSAWWQAWAMAYPGTYSLKNFRIVNIDQERWQIEPGLMLSEIAERYGSLAASATLGYQLTNAPLTDPMLKSIETALPEDCVELILIEMYNAAGDIRLKERYAERLLERFYSTRVSQEMMQGKEFGIEEATAVEYETWPAMTKIFREYLYLTAYRDEMEKAALSMLVMGGKEAMEELAGLALRQRSLYTDELAHAALKALVVAAEKDPDAIPFVERILRSKDDEAVESRDKLWKQIGRIVADERLLPVVTEKLEQIKENTWDDMDSGGLIRYMMRVGAPAFPYLTGFVMKNDIRSLDLLKAEIMEHISRSALPEAQDFLKSYLQAATLPHNGPNKETVLYDMSHSKNFESYLTMLKLLGDKNTGPALQTNILYELENIEPDVYVLEQAMMELLHFIDQKKNEEMTYAAEAALSKLSGRYRFTLSDHFTRLYLPLQRYLIGRFPFSTKGGFVDPLDLRRHYSDPALSQEIKKQIDGAFLLAVRTGIKKQLNGFDLAPFLASRQFEVSRFSIWKTAVSAVPDINLVVEVMARTARSGDVKKKYRLLSLRRIADSTNKGIDDLLLGFVKDDDLPMWLRGAAIDRLAERAGRPKFAAAARMALRGLIPMPSKLQRRAQTALRSSTKK